MDDLRMDDSKTWLVEIGTTVQLWAGDGFSFLALPPVGFDPIGPERKFIFPTITVKKFNLLSTVFEIKLKRTYSEPFTLDNFSVLIPLMNFFSYKSHLNVFKNDSGDY